MSKKEDISDATPLDRVCNYAKVNYDKLAEVTKEHIKRKIRLQNEKAKNPRQATAYDIRIAQVDSVIDSYQDQMNKIMNGLGAMGCPIPKTKL